MNSLLKIAHVLDIIPRTLGKAGGWLVLPLIAVIMFDVITRKIDFLRIGMSELSFYYIIEPIKLQDFEWHLHGVLLLLSFGFGYLMNTHVRVDIFRDKLAKRSQAKLELAGLIFMGLPFALMTVWFALVFVYISFQQGEGSESLTGIPMRYIVKSAAPIGFILLLSAFVATELRLYVYLYGDEAAKEEADGLLTIFPEEDEAAVLLVDEDGMSDPEIYEEGKG